MGFTSKCTTKTPRLTKSLHQYKDSNDPREHEVFSYMIHFLFDEYKFFQSYYPPRELAMTGYLFGSLIRHSLIDYLPLGIAMRYIIDALTGSCPPDMVTVIPIFSNWCRQVYS